MAGLTDEQLAVLMGMGDIGGKEDEQQRQMLQAQQLRGSMPSIRGGGIGSQIGRAAYGVAGAMGNYKAGQLTPQISSDKRNLLAELLRARRKTPGEYSPGSSAGDGLVEE